MAIDYRRMKATATRLITENGTSYDITRKGSVSVVGGIEHHDDELLFNAIGVKTDYQLSEIDGTNILNGDIQIAFTADADLAIGDRVDVDGIKYRIVKPNPVKPATILICYKAQLRA